MTVCNLLLRQLVICSFNMKTVLIMVRWVRGVGSEDQHFLSLFWTNWLRLNTLWMKYWPLSINTVPPAVRIGDSGHVCNRCSRTPLSVHAEGNVFSSITSGTFQNEIPNLTTERFSSPLSYFGESWFKSWPGNRLFLPKFSWFCWVLLEISGMVP
jgi:hypothetical protein